MTSYIAHVSECVQVKLREEVLRLALDMEEKLSRNDHKGGWNGMSLWQLFDRMLQEERELMSAIEGGFAPNIIDECVDVANFAMMIAELARKMEKRDAGLRADLRGILETPGGEPGRDVEPGPSEAGTPRL